MIQLHSWATPNGHKVHIMLEETALDYNVRPVDINAGDQFRPEFLKISPNNKIPAIVDESGPGGKPMALAESGAILIYLAEKTGQLLPSERTRRYKVFQWLMFQMGHIGPMLGQAHHFRSYAPVRISYGIERYTQEANRLYAVLDKQLAENQYVAGNDYSIADIAVFPWLRSHRKQGVALEDHPHVKRWCDTLGARPAVQRGLQVLSKERIASRADGFENLFGADQFRRRQT